MTDRRRIMTSTQRDLQPRVAARAPTPSSGVPTVSFDDERTTEIDLLEVDEGTRAGLRQERAARRRLTEALATQARQIGDQQTTIGTMGRAIDALALATADAKTAAAAVRLARQIRSLLLAVAVLVPGAALGAGKAFLAARDEAARAAGVAAAEQASLRHDVDTLRAEVAALTHLLRGDTP